MFKASRDPDHAASQKEGKFLRTISKVPVAAVMQSRREVNKTGPRLLAHEHPGSGALHLEGKRCSVHGRSVPLPILRHGHRVGAIKCQRGDPPTFC